jgi:hypothetical protein
MRCGGIPIEDGCHLNVQVAHHGVAIPATHHADVLHVNSALQYYHGSAGAEGACTGLPDMHSCVVEVSHHGMAKYIHDVLDLDSNASITTVLQGNGSGCLGLMQVMVLDSPDGGFSWTTQDITTRSLDHLPTLGTILLGGESIRYQRGRIKFRHRSRQHTQAPSTHIQCNIL